MDILVIDNDKTSREVIGFLIEEEGHTMQAASWSPRVLDRLRSKAFDAVLLDLDSSPEPWLDPVLALQQIRPDVLVVLMVVENRLRLAAEAASRGIVDVLEKPFRRDDLVLVMARLQRIQQLSRRIAQLETSAKRERLPVPADEGAPLEKSD
jgi:DNA-binding NtrC family response regulator